jgi:hypothetical protein
MICDVDWLSHVTNCNRYLINLFISVLWHVGFFSRYIGFLDLMKSFGFERTWWMLFQKRGMRTKFDIYVFISYDITEILLKVETSSVM